MIRYEGRIVQFGFGAVGKSFYEKAAGEICFDENRYFVITGDPSEFEAYVNLGGIVSDVYKRQRQNGIPATGATGEFFFRLSRMRKSNIISRKNFCQ